jgi:hypothetical protein
MNSPREILSALVKAASDVTAELRFGSTADLLAAVAALDVALDNASEELNRSHQLVAFVEKGKITNVFADVDMHTSCMVLSWDTEGRNHDDPDLVEVSWTGIPAKSEPLLAINKPCQVDPVLVSDIERAFDELRAKALAAIRQRG